MAGSSVKDIRMRIRSVESTMQITHAMELVATSKLRRARERMESSKPYAELSKKALAITTGWSAEGNSPYLAVPQVEKACYVVIAGDRGLAGGYNANIFRTLAGHSEGKEYCVLPIGKKAVERYSRLQGQYIESGWLRVEGMSVSDCIPIAERILEGFRREEFNTVYLVYTSFETMLTQTVRIEQLLPLVPQEQAGDAGNVLSDMEPQEALEQILPGILTGRIYSALCDAFASEVASRRTAMDSATKNAGEMISGLSLKYNRARQGAITQEITEIVAGANS